MNPKKAYVTALKSVEEYCSKGELEALYKLLLIHHNDFDDKTFLKILVLCLNKCVKNENAHNISLDYLYKVLKLIVSSIKELNEIDLKTYLQTVYHLMKEFADKDCYDYIIDMEKIVCPPFMPSEIPSPHKQIYHGFGKMLHNVLLNYTSHKSKKTASILKLGFLVLKVTSITSNPLFVLDLSYRCFMQMCMSKIDTENLEHYYKHILDLTEHEMNCLESNEFFKWRLKFILAIFNKYLENCNFDKANSFLHETENSTENDSESTICQHIYNLLKFLIVMSPLECGDKHESIRNCRKSLEYFENDVFLASKFGFKFNVLIHTITNYYIQNEDQWRQMSEKLQLEILQFICDFLEIRIYFEAECHSTCFNRVDISYTLTFFDSIIKLSKISDQSEEFHKKCAEMCTSIYPHIRRLKNDKCVKWKNSWVTILCSIRNITHHVNSKCKISARHYNVILIQGAYIFNFGQEEKGFMTKREIHNILASLCLHSPNLRQKMAYTAFGFFIFPEQRDFYLRTWMNTKSKLKVNQSEHEEMLNMTIAECLKKCSNELSVLSKREIHIEPHVKFDLVCEELRGYKALWKSRLCMLNALKVLNGLTTNKSKVIEIVVEIFGDCELRVHEDLSKLLKNILNDYLNKSYIKEISLESQIYLAIFYYINYKYAVREAINENVNEIEKAAKVGNDLLENEWKDPYEECDVVSCYLNLKLNKFICHIKYLNRSLELLTAAVSDIDSIPKCSETLYSVLMNIAFEYKLMCYSTKSVHSFQLALKFAQLENNLLHIIQSITFLIEKTDIHETQKLIETAEECRHTIDIIDASNIQIIVTYLIFKAKILLYSDPEESYEIFNEAKMIMLQNTDADCFGIVKSQLFSLHFYYFQLPCTMKIVDHTEYAPIKIYTAISTIYEEHRKTKLCSAFEFSLLFEICEEIIKFYYQMQCPREVRQYGKEVLLLAQKMVLPLWSVKLLTYLAWADIYTCHYDDCQVKLNGITDILCLPKYEQYAENDVPKKVSKKSKVRRSASSDTLNGIDSIAEDVKGLVLEVPGPSSKTCKKQKCPSSPTFEVESFRYPSFVKHDDTCDCFCCTCFEYQVLLIYKIRLSALFNMKEQNWSLIQDFFDGALNLHQMCSKRYISYCHRTNFLRKTALEKEFLLAYGYLLLDYSKHLMRNDKREEAIDTNKKLIDLINPTKIEHVYLYQEAILQKLVYLTYDKKTEVEVPKINLITADDDDEVSNDLPKTPESHHNIVTIPASSPPQSPLPKLKLKKRTLFQNSSPEDPSKSPDIRKEEEESSYIKKENMRTPAPKIQIYTESTKKTRKKKVKDIVESVLTTIVRTPPPAGTDENPTRKTRTRLLTEKLKRTSKKNENHSNDENAVCALQDPVDATKKSVRKNLLSDLLGNKKKDKVQEENVRKSSRNKKK